MRQAGRSRCRRARRHRIGGLVLALSLSITACTAATRQGSSQPDRSAQPDQDAQPARPTEPDPPARPPHQPIRAFTADSWWNTPLPADPPIHPDEAAILDYMQTARQSYDGCVRLAGASNDWGQPVYWVGPDDPTYDVTVDIPSPPPEVHSLRIPLGAESAPTSDAAMTVFDVDKGYVTALSGATYDRARETWTATGATVTYLDSDGLHDETGRSDESRNSGSHRGNNGATMMARFDEVSAGAIEHVLKVATGPEASVRSVFPMIGSDGDSRRSVAPPQGLRFRLKPGLDLDSFDLAPQALVIARALQVYGFYIGDSAGVTALKLENTRASGEEQLWNLDATSLCALPLSSQYWDVLPEAYSPPGAAPADAGG